MTTKRELLDSLTEQLKKVTNSQDLNIEATCGKIRLTNASRSRDISPLFTKPELEQYLRAMIKGAELASANK